MKKIELTQGKVAIVDDEDYDRLSKHKWHAMHVVQSWYAIRKLPRQPGKPRPSVLMHRQILGISDQRKIDHRDGDGLNNRRANLRTATDRENSRNRNHKAKGCTSLYKGVYWNNNSRKWMARIHDGKLGPNNKARGRYLGYFFSERIAALVFDKAASESFGEFAALNFPNRFEVPVEFMFLCRKKLSTGVRR